MTPDENPWEMDWWEYVEEFKRLTNTCDKQGEIAEKDRRQG